MIKIRINSIIHNESLHSLIEAIQDAILLKDGNGRWLVINDAAKRLFHLHNVDWQGKTDKELGAEHPEMRAIYDKCHENDELTWNARDSAIFTENIVDEAGNIHEYEVRKAPVYDDHGARKLMVVIGKDITEKILNETNLRIANTAIESLEAIVVTDKNNQIQRVNRSFTRLTGYQPEEVIGKTTAILKSGRHDKKFYQEMWKSLTENRFWQGEIYDRRKNGEIYPKWLAITAVVDEDGEVSNYVGSFVDISERKEAKEAIHHLAYYDPLTNLPNRRMLHERLELGLSNSGRNQQFGAVLMIDLDHFKLINDTRGHAVGDLLLIEVANRLKSCVRKVDTVVRLGGDEFVIILEHLGKDLNKAAIQSEMVSNKLLEAINKPFMIAGYELHSSLSIGICLFTLPATTSDEMLKRADAAMYQAKAAGRNTLRFFDQDIHASLESRIKLENELRQVVTKNQLQLFYQAQVDQKGKIYGAEALLRWEHPVRGQVAPNDFIPLAEESNLILSIGEWVLRTACLQLKTWEDNRQTEDLQLAVNVSARQFSQPNFVEIIGVILEETGAKASLLKLELTESSVLQNVESVIDKMKLLKSMGIHFSIDDFGTGYSSLSYLTKLPISQLKIDRTFVKNINTYQNDAVVAQMIIGMANNLGFNVIAEGVETEAQRIRLESFGCSYYQGYLFSKPVSLTNFESLVYGANDS